MVNPTETVLSLLPVIIVASVVLGVVFMIMIGLFMSRRISLNIRAWGALTLTLASILLLSGLWCMFLSPTATYTETRDSISADPVSIAGLRSLNFTRSLIMGDVLAGSAGRFREDMASESFKSFNLRVYDPLGSVVWSQTGVTYGNFNIRALTSGAYAIELQNPSPKPIDWGYIYYALTTTVTYRPLEPAGQWLSLISLPIFGLGIWASGILVTRRRGTRMEETGN